MRITDILFALLLTATIMVPFVGGAWLYSSASSKIDYTHGPGCPAPTYET